MNNDYVFVIRCPRFNESPLYIAENAADFV